MSLFSNHHKPHRRYGLAHTVARFGQAAQAELHTDTTVAGLYLVGQDCFCVGIASVLVSGYLTACRLEKRAFAATLLEALLA